MGSSDGPGPSRRPWVSAAMTPSTLPRQSWSATKTSLWRQAIMTSSRRRRHWASPPRTFATSDRDAGGDALRHGLRSGGLAPPAAVVDDWTMCRNITTLRGLEPPATTEEIEAAARQYVRKVSGITHPAPTTEEAFERAVASVAKVTADVLRDLPQRRQPPKAVPPLRRPEVRARLA